MKGRALTAIGLWIAGLVVCGVIVGRTHFTADLSAFLPRAPTAEQKVLVDQLKDGAVSRLVLIGIEGADAENARHAVQKSRRQAARVKGVSPRSTMAKRRRPNATGRFSSPIAIC